MDDLLRGQLDHDTWATREILIHCEPLAPENFRRDFEIGFGSLERTLAHLIEVTFFFADALSLRSDTPRVDFESDPFTPAELLNHLEDASTDLREGVSARLADGSDGVELPLGSGRRVPLPVLLAQAFDHGSHHRAQCLYMLKKLGVSLETHPLRFAGLDPGD